MKKILILTIFLFAIKAKAQYTPLNLDTTCIWLHDFFYYSGSSGAPFSCSGEAVSFVEKDTLINGDTYHKIITYTSKIGSASGALCYLVHYPNNVVTFIKEDTLAHKVYRITNSNPLHVAVDYNYQVGDSMKIFSYYMTPILDSINQQIYNGIIRFTWWGSTHNYKLIEGIGANYNFPSSCTGEWGEPCYKLKAYAKNGIVLYGDTSYPVIKYPAVSLDVPVIPESTSNIKNLSFSYILTNNTLQIKNPLLQNLQVNIYNYIGQNIFTTNCKTDNYNLPLQNILNNTMYIIEIKSKNDKLVDKFSAN